ncbi:MAG: hypothetical protein WCC90_03410 [Methylocella sp.]
MLDDPWSLPEERAPEKTGCHYERAYGEPNKNSGFNNLLNLLADDAVGSEPVSPSNFPVIREKTGNFEIIANLEQKTGANFEANSECYRQIPCATEQGIAFARTGNFEQQNRECIRAIRESA